MFLVPAPTPPLLLLPSSALLVLPKGALPALPLLRSCCCCRCCCCLAWLLPAAAAAAVDLFGVWNSLLRSSSAVMSGALRRLGVLFIKQFTFYCGKSVAKYFFRLYLALPLLLAAAAAAFGLGVEVWRKGECCCCCCRMEPLRNATCEANDNLDELYPFFLNLHT